MRLAIYAYSGLLIMAMYSGIMSNARPGAMTWGPTTDFWASAIAISHIEYGLGGGLGYRAISFELARHLTTTGSDINVHDDGTRALVAQPEKVEEAFRAAAQLPRNAMQDGPIESGTYVTTWAEDIGYADFYELAFRLFGYHALSTYWLFFSILVLSFLLFAAGNWDDDVATSALGVAVAATFLTGTADIFSDMLPNPAANRYLAILTILPCLHLLLAGLAKRPVNGVRFVLMAAQLVLYGLTITFRTPAIWTAIAAITVLLAFASIKVLHARKALPARPTRSWRQFAGSAIRSPPIVVAGAIAFAAVGLPNLRDTQLHSVYLDEATPHHLRWHSAIVGLSLHPLWPVKKPSQDLPDEPSDMIGFKMFEHYMQENRPGEPITSPKVINLYPAHLHDAIMKKKLFEFARANPEYMIELYGYYKPKLALSQLEEGLRTIHAAAWLITLPTLIFAFILLSGTGINLTAMIAVALITWTTSLLPVIWAYSANHVIAERLWTTIVLGAILALAVLIRGYQIASMVFQRPNTEL